MEGLWDKEKDEPVPEWPPPPPWYFGTSEGKKSHLSQSKTTLALDIPESL